MQSEEKLMERKAALENLLRELHAKYDQRANELASIGREILANEASLLTVNQILEIKDDNQR